MIASQRANIRPTDNVVGPGDLIEVNVFDLPEMNRKERVSLSGFVQMPLIGAVQAAGKTETAIADDIRARLSANYLQNPQVSVYILEFKSQQVAVTGSVARPGLYSLTREKYTIMSMLSEAGGVTREAGPIIEFVPSSGGRRSAAFEAASSGNTSTVRNAVTDSITIDLQQLLKGGSNSRLAFPVVDGDVIYVPEAGGFSIEGWVDKSGTFPITRRMTVLGAVSAAGGPLFPAKLGQVEVLQAQTASGNRETRIADLNAIRAGEAPDLELRPGDVVYVPGSVPLMIPWGIYKAFETLVRVGVGASVGVVP